MFTRRRDKTAKERENFNVAVVCWIALIIVLVALVLSIVENHEADAHSTGQPDNGCQQAQQKPTEFDQFLFH